MEFNDREPIYWQIIEDFKKKAITGVYPPGGEVPSRRELARMLGVNPNTVQRAYKEMEDMNLITTSRGQGSALTDDPERIAAIRKDMLQGIVSDFIGTLRSLGLTDDEIADQIAGSLRRNHGGMNHD